MVKKLGGYMLATYRRMFDIGSVITKIAPYAQTSELYTSNISIDLSTYK